MTYEDRSIAKGAAVLDALAAEDTREAIDGPTARVISLDIDELLTRTFPVQEPLLGPWLRKQTLAMVHAWRGVGKTHFALGVAYAVASGGRFLKWQADRPRRVLYIDGEMPGAAIQTRLAALKESLKGEPEPAKGYFRIVTPDIQTGALPDLSTLDGQRAYGKEIGDAELITADNLSALARTGVENEGESWLPIADWALARRREGRAVLFLHHDGKNGQQRGSSRREDFLDVVMSLARPPDYSEQEGARFVVKFRKARGLYGSDVEEIEAALGPSPAGTQQWTWKPAQIGRDTRILEMLQLGMSDMDVATTLGCDRTTIYRARKRLGNAGVVARPQRPV